MNHRVYVLAARTVSEREAAATQMAASLTPRGSRAVRMGVPPAGGVAMFAAAAVVDAMDVWWREQTADGAVPVLCCMDEAELWAWLQPLTGSIYVGVATDEAGRRYQGAAHIHPVVTDGFPGLIAHVMATAEPLDGADPDSRPFRAAGVPAAEDRGVATARGAPPGDPWAATGAPTGRVAPDASVARDPAEVSEEDEPDEARWLTAPAAGPPRPMPAAAPPWDAVPPPSRAPGAPEVLAAEDMREVAEWLEQSTDVEGAAAEASDDVGPAGLPPRASGLDVAAMRAIASGVPADQVPARGHEELVGRDRLPSPAPRPPMPAATPHPWVLLAAATARSDPGVPPAPPATRPDPAGPAAAALPLPATIEADASARRDGSPGLAMPPGPLAPRRVTLPNFAPPSGFDAVSSPPLPGLPPVPAAEGPGLGLAQRGRQRGVGAVRRALLTRVRGLVPSPAGPKLGTPAFAASELCEALMERRGAIVCVGALKGGVGKTSIASLLVDWAGQIVNERGAAVALVDANLNNPDAWNFFAEVGDGAPTLRSVLTALENGEAPPEPIKAGRSVGVKAAAQTPLPVAFFPERHDAMEYTKGEIDWVAQLLRTNYRLTGVDLANVPPSIDGGPAATAALFWLLNADVVVVPTDVNPSSSLPDTLRYLGIVRETRGVRPDGRLVVPVLVPYIVVRNRRVRTDPSVQAGLRAIEQMGATLHPIPYDERVMVAGARHVSLTQISPRLNAAGRLLVEHVITAYAERVPRGTR